MAKCLFIDAAIVQNVRNRKVRTCPNRCEEWRCSNLLDTRAGGFQSPIRLGAVRHVRVSCGADVPRQPESIWILEKFSRPKIAGTRSLELPPLILPLRLVSPVERADRKSTRLNSSHRCISYAVFCLKKER